MKLYSKQLASIMMASIVASFSTATDLFATTVDLCADTTTITMPDGIVVPVWGFGLTPVSGSCPVTLPGPQIVVPTGETTLTINLTNRLPVPVSVYIPGLQLAPLPTPQGGRVMSFTSQAAAALPGGQTTATISFTGLKPGTFIYQSGTNPAVQIPMGLFGALTIRSATAGQAYNNALSSYDNERTIVFSEIDPVFNTTVSNNGALNSALDAANNVNLSLSYAPRYYLLNGKTFPDTSSPASQLTAPPGQRTLLRLINAGVKNHVPTITGLPVRIIGEDGNYLTYARKELAPVMGAGKTLDAIIDLTAATNPPAQSTLSTGPNFFSMFDRRSWRADSKDTTGTMLGFINSFAAGQNCSPFKGDMNADNKIDMVDVLIVLNKYVISGNDPVGDVTPLAANGLPCGKGTGVLALSDVMYILRKAIGVN